MSNAKTITVFLVEDDALYLRALELEISHNTGYIIKTFATGELCLENLSLKPDIIILDYYLNRIDKAAMNGLETLDKIKAADSHIPVIILSAQDKIELAVSCRQHLATDYIVKSETAGIRLEKALAQILLNQKMELELELLNKDLKNKNIELEISNKELEAFNYSVSHDLRAPLRVVNGYAMILEEKYTNVLDDEGKHLFNQISIQTEKMTRLIDTLLKFSHIGKKVIKKVTVDMDMLVKEVLDDLQVRENKKLDLIIRNLPQISGDPELLKQVFVNLLTNAIKYSSKRDIPTIEIGAQAKDNENIYYVKDNGAGFNMAYSEKLFNAFQRLHENSEFEGIGIGLTIVHSIVSRSGGTVWAESQINQGATFYFSLPLDHPSAS